MLYAYTSALDTSAEDTEWRIFIKVLRKFWTYTYAHTNVHTNAHTNAHTNVYTNTYKNMHLQKSLFHK